MEWHGSVSGDTFYAAGSVCYFNIIYKYVLRKIHQKVKCYNVGRTLLKSEGRLFGFLCKTSCTIHTIVPCWPHNIETIHGSAFIFLLGTHAMILRHYLILLAQYYLFRFADLCDCDAAALVPLLPIIIIPSPPFSAPAWSLAIRASPLWSTSNGMLASTWAIILRSLSLNSRA